MTQTRTPKAQLDATLVDTTSSQSLTNKSVNGVTLTSSSSSTAFLNGIGGYTTPAGGVTSVAMTGDGVVFNSTVSGSPITSSGTLAPALLSQTANTVLAAPNGSSGTPTFRTVVPADLPIATSSSLGIVQPDNSTVTINSGILSSSLAGGTYNVKTYGALGTEQQVFTGSLTSGAGHNLTITLPVISITASGSGYNYTSVPTVSGLTGTSTQVILSGGTSGTVIGINVLISANYSSSQTATLSAPATGSAPTLTVTLATGFQSGDVGKICVVQGAGVSSAILNTTISAVVNQFTATLAANASTTVTNKQVDWGFDDSNAFNEAVTAASQNPNGGTVFIPAGRYLINQTIYWCSQVSMYGVGSRQAVLIGAPGLHTTGTSVIQQQSGIYSAGTPMVDCVFQHFEIDQSVVQASGTTGEKCIYMQYLDRSLFFDLYLHDSPGTCLGSDFMNRTSIINCVIANGGRGGTGSSFGNSGIGVGTNTAAQGCDIIGNYVSGCTRYGIFLENQNTGINSAGKGVRIIGNTCTNNMYGIGDSGCSGAIIQGNVCYSNVQRSSTGGHGIAIDEGTLTHAPGNLDLVSGNQCFSNAGDGIRVDTSGAGVSSAALADIYPTIIGNKCYSNTGYGINIVCNTTSTYNTSAVIKDNVLEGNTAGAFTSSGNFLNTTGRPIWIQNNVGYNDTQTPASITVGASPFTYTAGNTPENVYVTGGTISSITKNGVGLSGAVTGDLTIPLLPSQSIIVTYTVAPTMVTDKN